MTAAAHYGTARDVLEKARRERTRLAVALSRSELTEAADHFFNLTVSVLAVSDWIEKTAPPHSNAASTFVRTDPAIRQEVGRAYRRAGEIYQMLGQAAQAEGCHENPRPASLVRRPLQGSGVRRNPFAP